MGVSKLGMSACSLQRLTCVMLFIMNSIELTRLNKLSDPC